MKKLLIFILPLTILAQNQDIRRSGGGGGESLWTNSGSYLKPIDGRQFLIVTNGSVVLGGPSAISFANGDETRPYLGLYTDPGVGENTTSKVEFGSGSADGASGAFFYDFNTSDATQTSSQITVGGFSGSTNSASYFQFEFSSDVGGATDKARLSFMTTDNSTALNIEPTGVTAGRVPYHFDVTPSASSGSIFELANDTTNVFTVDYTGKITATGVVDPPAILLDLNTRDKIVAQSEAQIPADKGGGAMLFFNSETHKLETYVPSDGTFYDMLGEKLEQRAVAKLKTYEQLHPKSKVKSAEKNPHKQRNK